MRGTTLFVTHTLNASTRVYLLRFNIQTPRLLFPFACVLFTVQNVSVFHLRVLPSVHSLYNYKFSSENNQLFIGLDIDDIVSVF